MPIRSRQIPQCPNCGHDGSVIYCELSDRLYSVDGIWSLLECKACDWVWLSPRPDVKDIPKLYRDYHTHSDFKANLFDKGFRGKLYAHILNTQYQYPGGYSGNPFIQLMAKSSFLQDEIGKKIMFLGYKPSGTLLDVGAGNGKFLWLMKNLGWSVSGVEPDQTAAKVAERRLGVKIFAESFDELPLDHSTYDAITMDHVIEHFISPGDSLKRVTNFLKPNGILVILTPNIESFGHRYFKSSWLHLDPPRHFHLFGPKPMIAAAEKAGLEIVKVRTISSSAWWIYISSKIIRNQGRIPGGTLAKSDLSVTNIFRGLNFLIWERSQGLIRFKSMHNSGEELLLIARKPSKEQHD